MQTKKQSVPCCGDNIQTCGTEDGEYVNNIIEAKSSNVRERDKSFFSPEIRVYFKDSRHTYCIDLLHIMK